MTDLPDPPIRDRPHAYAALYRFLDERPARSGGRTPVGPARDNRAVAADNRLAPNLLALEQWLVVNLTILPQIATTAKKAQRTESSLSFAVPPHGFLAIRCACVERAYC